MVPIVQLKQSPCHIRRMNPENAEKYMFRDRSGVECIGSEAFYHMLAQFGASVQYVSKEYYFVSSYFGLVSS